MRQNRGKLKWLAVTGNQFQNTLSCQWCATEPRQLDNHQPSQPSICTAQLVLNASVAHLTALLSILVVYSTKGLHSTYTYSGDEMCADCCNSKRRHGSGQEKNCGLLPLNLCKSHSHTTMDGLGMRL